MHAMIAARRDVRQGMRALCAHARHHHRLHRMKTGEGSDGRDLLLTLQHRQLVSNLGPCLDALGVASALELLDSLFDDPRRALAIPSPARASVDGVASSRLAYIEE